MQVYKINYICLNQDKVTAFLNKSQFCLCYNDGIKIYNIDPLMYLSSSNTKTTSLVIIFFNKGDIAIATLFYRTQNLAFVGGSNNTKYYSKKLVLWDNVSKTEINSQVFLSKIINIKSMKNYIFSQTENKIYVTSLNEKIMEIIKVVNNNTSCNIIEVFLDIDKNIVFSTISEKNIDSFYVMFAMNNSYLLKDKSCGFQNGIQNIFFSEATYSLFIVDKSGKYISGYLIKDGTMICSFYRGNLNAVITSLTAVNNEYISISSSTKTIHLFHIDNNELVQVKNESWMGKNLFSLKQRFLNPFGLNKSKIKIRINSDTDESYYDNDFNKKGSILFYANDTLNCIGYNGKLYKIKFDFNKLTFTMTEIIDWQSYEEPNEDMEVSIVDSVNINENFISEKNEKDSQKWVLTNK